MQTTKLLFVIGLVGTLAASERTYSAVDTARQIQARQAVRQKMAELDALSATNTAPALAPVPAPVPGAKMPSSSEFGPVPEAVTNANASRYLAAMRAEMALLKGAPTVPTKSGRPTVSTALIASTPLVMEVPPDPLTSAKAARMAELLQRYKADQITPKEYHTQRAAILAEP
jgi:hypothetical protein